MDFERISGELQGSYKLSEIMTSFLPIRKCILSDSSTSLNIGHFL